jgi:hypothetical protein
MPDKNPKKDSLQNVPSELLIAYYEHQYDRMKQLEDQRFNITNLTIGISVLAFTFGFDKSVNFSRQAGFILLATIIVVNLFAIAFIEKSASWISTHRRRAKGILEFRSTELFKFDMETHADFKQWIPGRWKIQLLLHATIVIMSIVMIVAWALP